MTTAVMMARGIRGLDRSTLRTNREESSRWSLSTLRARVALVVAVSSPMAMMRRLMEYRASWVRMPARMAGMPQAVWSRPVTRPASMPARMAITMAAQGFQPMVMHTAHTAPPVVSEPSTVRSAMSRMR